VLDSLKTAPPSRQTPRSATPTPPAIPIRQKILRCAFLGGAEAMATKSTVKRNIYINPNAPTWLKSMLLERMFRDAIRDGTVKVLGAEEMQDRLHEITSDTDNHDD
jgi:hypothetical protein